MLHRFGRWWCHEGLVVPSLERFFKGPVSQPYRRRPTATDAGSTVGAAAAAAVDTVTVRFWKKTASFLASLKGPEIPHVAPIFCPSVATTVVTVVAATTATAAVAFSVAPSGAIESSSQDVRGVENRSNVCVVDNAASLASAAGARRKTTCRGYDDEEGTGICALHELSSLPFSSSHSSQQQQQQQQQHEQKEQSPNRFTDAFSAILELCPDDVRRYARCVQRRAGTGGSERKKGDTIEDDHEDGDDSDDDTDPGLVRGSCQQEFDAVKDCWRRARAGSMTAAARLFFDSGTRRR
jgi:hypothetical protein